MGNLKLTFSGRRSVSNDDLGDYMRVNTKNGNVKLAKSVISKLGFQLKDKLNVSFFEGVGYLAQEDRGFTLGDNDGFSAVTMGSDFASNYAKQMGDNTVVYVTVDTENPIEADTEDADGKPVTMTVYPLEFLKAEPAKKSTRGGSEEEEEEEEEEENSEI